MGDKKSTSAVKSGLRLLGGALLLAGISAQAAAHEVWLERDGAGPARLYLKEIADDVQEADETHRLKGAEVFVADRAKLATLTRKDDFFEAAVTGKGDARLYDENVFAPWTEDNIRQAQIHYARAGRTETQAKLDFELVPVAAGSDTFVAMFRGKPVANTIVTVFSPARWQKPVRADAQGRFTVPDQGKGRYIVLASAPEDAERLIAGETVARVHHLTTISFTR